MDTLSAKGKKKDKEKQAEPANVMTAIRAAALMGPRRAIVGNTGQQSDVAAAQRHSSHCRDAAEEEDYYPHECHVRGSSYWPREL